MSLDTEEKEVIEKEKSMTDNKVKWLSAIIGVMFLITWIIILIMALQQRNMPAEEKINLIPALIITGVITLVCIMTFFFRSIYKKIKPSESKLVPKAITKDRVKEMIGHCLENYSDHISGFGDLRILNIGNNTIYCWEIIPLISENPCFAIINANYPEMGISVIGYSTKIDPRSDILKEAINKMSTNPIYEDIESRTETDLNQGLRKEWKKKSISKKEIKKEDSDGVMV